MSRYFIPIILLLLTSIGILAYLYFYTSPYLMEEGKVIVDKRRVGTFLVFLFLGSSCVITTFLYLASLLLGDYIQPRLILRKSLRQGLLLSLGLIVALVFYLTNTANILTLGLTTAVVIMLELSFRGQ